MAIIEVKNATKKFRESTALSDVTVSFEKGLIHGVIGRNGSGKTVLFKSICGLMHLTEGEILVRGKRVGKDIDVPPDIGIVIENPGFLPSYSGMRNLMYLAKIRNLVDRSQVEESMRFVGLDPKSKKHVAKYSMGMRQRLAIAQATMENPDILFLDEPMNGLDNQGVKEIREAIRTLKEQGKTILLASHNPLDIEELCDTVHEMDAGVIRQVRP
ncbi:MAG TPA: ABC transporter ATP-binding protein [Bacillota bacterium]|nr:ABC transporter ATP-binding protein [Bacillota bacterium]